MATKWRRLTKRVSRQKMKTQLSDDTQDSHFENMMGIDDHIDDAIDELNELKDIQKAEDLCGVAPCSCSTRLTQLQGEYATSDDDETNTWSSDVELEEIRISEKSESASFKHEVRKVTTAPLARNESFDDFEVVSLQSNLSLDEIHPKEYELQPVPELKAVQRCTQDAESTTAYFSRDYELQHVPELKTVQKCTKDSEPAPVYSELSDFTHEDTSANERKKHKAVSVVQHGVLPDQHVQTPYHRYSTNNNAEKIQTSKTLDSNVCTQETLTPNTKVYSGTSQISYNDSYSMNNNAEETQTSKTLDSNVCTQETLTPNTNVYSGTFQSSYNDDISLHSENVQASHNLERAHEIFEENYRTNDVTAKPTVPWSSSSRRPLEQISVAKTFVDDNSRSRLSVSSETSVCTREEVLEIPDPPPLQKAVPDKSLSEQSISSHGDADALAVYPDAIHEVNVQPIVNQKHRTLDSLQERTGIVAQREDEELTEVSVEEQVEAIHESPSRPSLCNVACEKIEEEKAIHHPNRIDKKRFDFLKTVLEEKRIIANFRPSITRQNKPEHETITEGEVLTPSNYLQPGRGKFEDRVRRESVSSLEESGDRIQQEKAMFSMSAPVYLDFDEVKQHAAFNEVREFLVMRKYPKFFGTLLRAVKRNSEQAVRVMVEIVRNFGYDLSEPKFRERVYTASILHVALLFKRDAICRLLINAFPGLVAVKYTSEKFLNQTAVHIAASNGQCEILEAMLGAISKGVAKKLINTVADGTYFQEQHQEGALVLSAAAWNGYPEVVGTLIEYGADLGLRGPAGNTVLHYIVTLSAKYPKSEIPRRLFETVWEKCSVWWQRRFHEAKSSTETESQRKLAQVDAFRYLLLLKNDADQNIPSLAVNLHSNLTMRILNIEHIYKQPQTKFGAITWSTYDVTEVTSFLPPGSSGCSANRYNPSSVMHILAHRTKMVTTDKDENYNDLIEKEPISTLVEMKWAVYRWVYIVWCFIHLTLMISLSVVSANFYQVKNTAENSSDIFTEYPTNATAANLSNLTTMNVTNKRNQTISLPAELSEIFDKSVHYELLLFGVIPFIYIVLEVVDFLSTGYKTITLNQGISEVPHQFKGYLIQQWSVTGNGPYRLCGFLFSVSVLTWLGLHLTESADQDIPLSLALLFGWVFMLLFTRCCRYICRFSIMMQKMFFQDCLYFIAVYIFFWLAFSTAIHVLVLYGDQHTSVWTTLYGMLNVVTDAGDKASGNEARIPGVAGALLSIYAVISVILLLNMLIAMMNSSYEAVKSSKTNIWRNQQLSVILMIERRLWWWVWLCEKSQRHTWSPHISSKHGRKRIHPLGKRLYLEITEKSWQRDGSE